MFWVCAANPRVSSSSQSFIDNSGTFTPSTIRKAHKQHRQRSTRALLNPRQHEKLEVNWSSQHLSALRALGGLSVSSHATTPTSLLPAGLSTCTMAAGTA